MSACARSLRNYQRPLKNDKKNRQVSLPGSNLQAYCLPTSTVSTSQRSNDTFHAAAVSRLTLRPSSVCSFANANSLIEMRASRVYLDARERRLDGEGTTAGAEARQLRRGNRGGGNRGEASRRFPTRQSQCCSSSCF